MLIGIAPGTLYRLRLEARRGLELAVATSRGSSRGAPSALSLAHSLPSSTVTVQRMDHVGIVVEDLAAAREFFAALGLELLGEASLQGGVVDRIVGLEGVSTEIAYMQAPDGHGRVELTKFLTPAHHGESRLAPANAPGIRHISFLVEDIDAMLAGLRARGSELVGELERYEDSYRLCYVRGPEGIIVELAERIG